MAYKATHDVVQRVRPLLDRLAARTIDKARLLQFLSAMAGVDWGVLLLRDRAFMVEDGQEVEVLTLEDIATGAHHRLLYPRCLPRDLEMAVREEYKRLALDRRLTLMNATLFAYFYNESHCASCRWSAPAHEQIHRECRFAGWPINFEAAAERP